MWFIRSFWFFCIPWGNSSKKYINKWVGDYYCGFNGKYIKNQWVKTSGK
ncbi:hypothetical protein [Clostridium massiliamazoniense]